MKRRFWTRLLIAALAAGQWLGRRATERPKQPHTILVIAPLFAGDALLLTPLIASLRLTYPACALYLVAGRAVQGLYATQPYGVHVGVYDPRDPATLMTLRRWPTADLAVVAGESRYGWVARALGARWIVSFGGEDIRWRNRALDERVPLPTQAAAWSDIAAMLASRGTRVSYQASDWPDPPCQAFDLPPRPYCVLHVEASSPLKHWDPPKWLALADWLASRGYAVVWSAGREGQRIINQIDPGGRYAPLGCQLDLAQVWHLVKCASLLVSVDTSVSHIGKLTLTPTVVLFGPGSAALYGPGEFWRDSPWRGVMVPEVTCRDRKVLFKREIAWVRRCDRGIVQCAAPRCMQEISLAQVQAQVGDLLGISGPLLHQE